MMYLRCACFLSGSLLLLACSDDSLGTTGAGGDGTGETTGATTASGNAGGADATTSSTTGSSSTTTGGGGQGTGGEGATGLVRFVAMGDAGKGNQGQIDIGLAVAAKCAADGCDFVQLLGDNIYDSGVDGTDDPQWQSKFEVPYAPVDLPFWVVLGNHDYGGGGTGSEFGKGQNEIDYSNVSTKWKLPAAYYHHAMEHVEFFALDTNMAMFHQADDQADEVPGWLAESLATWRIVFGHHPYRSNGPHGNAGEYEGLPFVPITNGAGVKDLIDDVVCGNADLYISGHDHSLQWLLDDCSGTELIVSGGAASTTELEGDNPTHFESDALGFLYVRIENNTFTGEFIDAAGSVLYTRTITK